MDKQYPPGVKSVLKVLVENNISHQVRVFDAPARQASQAAALLECPLGAIVKSLVFQNRNSGELLMVLVSGKNRADLDVISRLMGEAFHPAFPQDVQSITGYPVGAVPPVCVEGKYPVIMDVDLLAYERVWASAGAINILIGLEPIALQRLTIARVENIKQTKMIWLR